MIDIDLTDNIDCVPAGVNESRTCAMNNVMTGVFNSIDPDIPAQRRHLPPHQRPPARELRRRHPALPPLLLGGHHQCRRAAGGDDAEGLRRRLGRLRAGRGRLRHRARLRRRLRHRLAQEDDPYVNQKFLGSQGGPAGPEIDGWVTYGNSVTNGLMFRDSVEIDEQKYPIRVTEIRVRTDSEGAGRRRGAPGFRVAYGPKHDEMRAFYVTDGCHFPPRGVRGGGDARGSLPFKVTTDGQEEALAAHRLHGSSGWRAAAPPAEWRRRLRRSAAARGRARARRRAEPIYHLRAGPRCLRSGFRQHRADRRAGGRC